MKLKKITQMLEKKNPNKYSFNFSNPMLKND